MNLHNLRDLATTNSHYPYHDDLSLLTNHVIDLDVYRILAVHEDLVQTDEFFSSKDWHKTRDVGTNSPTSGLLYRRKITCS